MNRISPEFEESLGFREGRPMASIAAAPTAISVSEIAAIVKPRACRAVIMATTRAGSPSSCRQSPNVKHECQRSEDDRDFGRGNVGQNPFSVQIAMRTKTS